MNQVNKFDYIIGNPPFGSVGGDTLHLKCLNLVYDKFTKKMIIIMPWGFVTKDTKSNKKYQIKFAPKLQHVKEVAGNTFEGTNMPSTAIYEFTNEETKTTILEDLSGNKTEKSDLTNVSRFNEYEKEIIKYLENQGQQLIVWAGGHGCCSKKSLNRKGIFDENLIKKLMTESIIKLSQHLYQYNSKTFLITNKINGGMNGTFMSSKVGLIFNNVDDLIRLLIERKICCGYSIIILNSIKSAENCKTALKNPLLRFTCYKTQLDQNMGIKRVYKYIPAINWEDEHCLTDEGLLEMCGCPKDKAKEYAEYVKHYVEERDKEIENRKKRK